ncbi:MAG: YqgE/AlgH family protein [Flavobacteriales bacterium]
MKIGNRNPEKGQLLLSEPFMNDTYFKQTVVLLADKNDKGTLGFILNKPVGYYVHELIQDFPEFDAPVYFGGPVESNSLFFIHRQPDKIIGGSEIGQGWYFGGNFEEIKQFIKLGLLKAEDIRFFAGYAGWDAGQLDFELEEDAWLVASDCSEFMVMNPRTMWNDLLRQSKSNFAIWSNIPENPQSN